jgi:hypothetical protein
MSKLSDANIIGKNNLHQSNGNDPNLGRFNKRLDSDESSLKRDDIIILPSGSMSNSKSAEIMFKIIAKYRELFLYGGRVVEVLRSKQDRNFALSPLDSQAFRSRIEHYGMIAAYRTGANGEIVLKLNARCSVDTANVLLASMERRLLPPITLLHNCPILTEHGVLRKGYHPVCGGRIIKSSVVPDEMSLKDAVRMLMEVIAEFDFLKPSDKSRAIAAMISPALRFGELLKKHFPLFMVEADLSQAGKGFLLELIQAIYKEYAAFVTKLKGGVGGFDESLAQKLIDGRPIIQIDNIRGTIDSQYFEAILTAPYGDTVSARVPHKPEILVRPDRFIFQLTSNGLTSTRDLANRSCIIRIRKRQGFAFKRYPDGNVIDHIRANPQKYLGAVYRVCSEWLAKGKPRNSDLRAEGRMREWAQALDWIVQRVFNLPPLMDDHAETQNRISSPGLVWLRDVCLVAEKEKRLREELSATDFVGISREHAIFVPGLANDADDDTAKLHLGRLLGRIFGENHSCECDGFLVTRSENDQYDKKYRRNITVKNYQIQRLPRQEEFNFADNAHNAHKGSDFPRKY